MKSTDKTTTTSLIYLFFLIQNKFFNLLCTVLCVWSWFYSFSSMFFSLSKMPLMMNLLDWSLLMEKVLSFLLKISTSFSSSMGFLCTCIMLMESRIWYLSDYRCAFEVLSFILSMISFFLAWVYYLFFYFSIRFA